MLWGIEPLAVGLALLAVYLCHHRPGLLIAGLILCGVAALAIIGMTLLLSEWWLLKLVGPAILVLVGLVLLASALGPRRLVQEA